MDASGNFVVVWDNHPYDHYSQSDIRARRYVSGGSPLGGEFQVNAYTTSYQFAASVVMGTSGEFVAVWHSEGSGGTDSDGRSVQRTLVGRIFADGFESGGTSSWSSTTP